MLLVLVLPLVPVEKMMVKHEDLSTSKSPLHDSDSSTVVQHSPLYFNIDGRSVAAGGANENDGEK